MSLDKLQTRIEFLKSASIFEKTAAAEATLDAAMEVLKMQQAEIENLTKAVNFLQKTMENNANA